MTSPAASRHTCTSTTSSREFRDFGASLQIFWTNLSNLALFRTSTLGVQWTTGVLGGFAFVLFEDSFRFGVPYLSLVMGKILPSEADYFGEGTVICLDLCRNVLTFDERIGWSRNMIFRFYR